MNAAQLDSMFQALLNRPATAEERNRLLELNRILKLKEDDPLWSILFALAHYQGLYERMPARIEAAARSVSEIATRDAKTFFDDERTRLYNTLATAVKDNLTDQSRIRLSWAIALASLGVFVVAFGCMMLGLYAGNRDGVALSARDMAWATGINGEAARRLTESGAISLIRRCQASGKLTIDENGRASCRTRRRGKPAQEIERIELPQLP